MNEKRLLQIIALIMVGDGVVGLIKPRRHSLLWDVGPHPFRKAMEELAEHPSTARFLYAAEIAVGAWLATQQTAEKPAFF